MPEKDPNNWASVQWWLPALTAAWGGMASYARQVMAGRKFNAIAWLVHMAVAGFAGLMFWLLSIESHLSGPLAAVVTGMAGFMGVEAIRILELRFKAGLPEDSLE